MKLSVAVLVFLIAEKLSADSIFNFRKIPIISDDSRISVDIGTDENLPFFTESSKLTEQLLLAHVIWRHGDRGPQNWLPKIEHSERDWPFGLNELTSIGMEQEFHLGQAIKRDMLSNFAAIERNEMYIHSTGYNRTIMSALANLASTFPDGRSGIDEPGNLTGWPGHWRPIPIHTFDYATDNLGNPQYVCPRMDELVQQLHESAQYQQLLAKNANFFEFLSSMTGSNVSDIDAAYYIQDYFICQNAHNISMPSWWNESLKSRLDELALRAFNDWFGLCNPRIPEMIRLSGGPLLGNIVGNMQMKIDCWNKAPDAAECQWINKLKYFGLSAHDHTIWALLGTLGNNLKFTDGQLPQYASAVGIQLWNIIDVGPAVKIFYRRGSSNPEFYPITQLVDGCPRDVDYCPLDLFINSKKQFIPESIENECANRVTKYAR